MHISAFLIALIAVGTMDFANQRGGTCTVAALEEVVLKRTFRRLIALFEASLWAAAGFVLLGAAGLLAATPVNYAIGVETILGGVLFGIGAFVNGACIFGTIARLGSGELSYLAMPIGFYFGSLASAYLPSPAQMDSRSPLIAASTLLAVPVVAMVLVRIHTHIRVFTDALRLELNRIDPNDKERRKKVNKLAEKLVECAIEDKQSWAFQQIADRLEGKPVQVVDARADDNRTLHQFSDAELTAILRRRVGIVPVESDEERPESGALN